MRLGFEYSSEANTHHQPLTETLSGLVDSLPSGMEEAGDKMVTKAGPQPAIRSNSDLKPHERDTFKTAEALLQKLGVPLVAAVEDYVRARELAGTESLAAMATKYGRHFQKVVCNVTVPKVVEEMLLHRE